MLTEWSPHAGQQTPSGQRMAIKRSRQEISSGKAVLTPPSGSCKYIIMFCRRASKSGCNTSCLAVGSRLLVILIARIFALAGSLTHHGLRILTKGRGEREEFRIGLLASNPACDFSSIWCRVTGPSSWLRKAIYRFLHAKKSPDSTRFPTACIPMRARCPMLTCVLRVGHAGFSPTVSRSEKPCRKRP